MEPRLLRNISKGSLFPAFARRGITRELGLLARRSQTTFQFIDLIVQFDPSSLFRTERSGEVAFPEPELVLKRAVRLHFEFEILHCQFEASGPIFTFFIEDLRLNVDQ